jgi:drug/metabolite transporter (DMT)-like permease
MRIQNQSLLFGLFTIILWGSLATFGTLLMHVPPFYLLGVSFIIGALPGLSRPRELFPSLKVSLWGIGGFFGYHFFLFYSFRFAPAVEANLINYLWPVFMVLFSPLFFRSQGLKWYHIAGSSLALIGCVFLVRGEGGEWRMENMKGYMLAFMAAVTWPIYSLGSKKMEKPSVFAIGGFCLGAGILCLITHALIEPRVAIEFHDGWKIVLMGLGPCGLAFYTWDMAIQKGDTRVLGALSYLTPVLSTLGLVIFAGQELKSSTLIAMLLIIGGASSGLLDFLPSKTLIK